MESSTLSCCFSTAAEDTFTHTAAGGQNAEENKDKGNYGVEDYYAEPDVFDALALTVIATEAIEAAATCAIRSTIA